MSEQEKKEDQQLRIRSVQLATHVREGDKEIIDMSQDIYDFITSDKAE